MGKPLLIITGVCGRIGTATAEMFSEHFQVIGLDICMPENPREGVEYFFADVSSIENVCETLAKVKEIYGDKIASFIHLAAYYNFSGGEWQKYQKITVDGTANLIEGLKDFQLEQFIFSSTLLVYKPTKPGKKIHEDSEVLAAWEYPLSKVKTEELIHEKLRGAKSVILRIAGVYDDECNSIPISQHIARIYEKQLESHLFPGNPHHGAAFLHMDDLVAALKLCVEKRKKIADQEIFILGEPEVMSFMELQNEIGRRLHGKPWWTLRIPKWFAKIGAAIKEKLPFFEDSFIKPWMIDLADHHYEVDIQKAERVLGWKPAHNLKNCLPKMIGELKQDPKKWYRQHGL